MTAAMPPVELLASGPRATLTTGHTTLGRIIAVDAVKGVLVEVSQ